ncbi:SDR family oxidoreductase [Tropicibacter sp. Alg240-R139]|uniref:SDR family NAD(P)-dependent oxidoreductase n=1 Tax=Tropicibacter sp. Alg240-R139 TaxID=2305991 RepID=UPI0013E08C4A|nr:SDR family oxidoreductase [Tropicibacter sp. Alg240-R139]
MNYFKRKVAIVTGAASGIGKAVAIELCKRGAHVIFTDRSEDQVKEACETAIKNGGHAEAIVLDVTDYEATRQVIDNAVSVHGKIDFMFNNAGIAIAGEFRDVDLEGWHRLFEINLFGVVNGMKAVYPVMIEQGSGHIINTSALAGLIPLPGNSVYVAAKHALVGLSSTVRIEGKDLGVKVSVVCPGHIKTPIFENADMIRLDKKKATEGITQIPGITAEQCARIVLKGVEKNKHIIVVTRFAKMMALFQRINTGLVHAIMGKVMRDFRENRK